MARPQYTVFASFAGSGQTWDTLATSFSDWDSFQQAFTWPDFVGGEVPDEDVRRVQFDRSGGGALGRVEIGRGQFLLLNDRGQYSPNAGTPGEIDVNDYISVKAFTSAGTWFPLWAGHVDNVRISADLGRRTAAIQAFDVSRSLRDTINTGIQLGTPVTSLYNIVLDAAGIPRHMRNVPETLTEAPDYAYLDNVAAGNALAEISQAGYHRTYVDGLGNLRVIERHFDQTDTVQASYNQFLGLTFSVIDNVINDARLELQPRKQSTDVQTVAWIDTGNPQIIDPGQSLLLFLEYVDPDTLESPTPANSVITPVQSADFQTRATSFGGTLTTSDMLLEFTPFAQTALVKVTNQGSVTSFITKMQARGHSLQKQPLNIIFSQALDSQTTYGRHTFTLATDLFPTRFFALNYAEFLTQRFAYPQPQVSVTLKNVFDDLVTMDLLDRVTVTESVTVIASEFHIVGMDHDIKFERGGEHSATYALQQAPVQNYLILDDATRGQLDTASNVLGF